MLNSTSRNEVYENEEKSYTCNAKWDVSERMVNQAHAKEIVAL